MFLFAEGGGHPTPLIVEFVNHYIGEPVHEFQVAYTQPLWNYILEPFGTNAEAVFGEYTVENAVPWYTIMFFIACILSVAIVWIFKGKLSEDDPHHGQLTLEAGFLAIKDLLVSAVGEHGFKYFPVVATFAVLVLISNLMGLFPMFMSPTAHISVTFALGIASFVYYNYVGISENGVINHLAHFAGPRLPLVLTLLITPLIFFIELISNAIRPLTLAIRLFANMFADEQIAMNIANLGAPFTQYLVPIAIMPLAVFVAFVQTLVFTLLSMIYISEVSHPPHDHHDDEHHAAEGEPAAATA
ncbi:MAG: ATP synthase F0 subunit A [Acidobacteria bacterium]|nr:MAG: ATP synthase F0 subunit A [Acidobacteriota bacterium]REK03923.1 MAG: ATP synthase F0 subunit A [Acidobacteriota bacterium]REK15085.1 MAG: ATP synthase F0 subunit A [Acidobacteriota bacterium]REK46175.1 MAG: ATP synthase F0 subunit A [Acidobacteriota bacterium]